MLQFYLKYRFYYNQFKDSLKKYCLYFFAKILPYKYGSILYAKIAKSGW